MDLFHARDRQTYYLVDLIPLQDLVAGLVYLVVQVDQIVEVQVDPSGPGTTGGLGGLYLSGHLS